MNIRISEKLGHILFAIIVTMSFSKAVMAKEKYKTVSSSTFSVWIAPEYRSGGAQNEYIDHTVKGLRPKHENKRKPSKKSPARQPYSAPQAQKVKATKKVKVQKVKMQTPDIVRPPKAKKLVAAKFPSKALDAGIEGYVKVKFDIDDKGKTQNIRVVSASPEGVFERSAIRAVKRWKYEPMTRNGVAMPYHDVDKKIAFRLGGK